ncbi:MAG TPA: hypothetical protein VFR02_09860 [bacterium]|nr:hypothetical protein [bacterium]
MHKTQKGHGGPFKMGWPILKRDYGFYKASKRELRTSNKNLFRRQDAKGAKNCGEKTPENRINSKAFLGELGVCPNIYLLVMGPPLGVAVEMAFILIFVSSS